MPTSLRKKLFLLVFCLASIAQGMYSTYFVSILTTIERIYQIQSKTAGAILSATEIGQILGSLFIAYYGGRGNKPKWMSVCMTFSAIAALISISPHFIQITTNHAELDVNRQAVTLESVNSPLISGSLSSYQSSDLSGQPEPHAKPSAFSRVEDVSSRNNLCRFENLTDIGIPLKNSNNTLDSILTTRAKFDNSEHTQPLPVTLIITIFSICLLVIGFGSTAITTLGIPFIDDIISKEESPLYLGLTIALRIFGPALGFILGSFCISLDLSSLSAKVQILAGQSGTSDATSMNSGWWIGLVVISLPLLILAIPMYFLSRNITINDGEEEDYGNITYQAAEDHDMIDDVDVYTVDQNIIDQWRAPNVCLVVNYLGTSGSTSFKKDELTHNQTFAPSLATRASTASTVSYTDGGKKSRKKQKLTQDKPTISDLSSSLSRLLQNKLLTLRMLSGVLHILPIAGFYTFLPKYLMEQFMVTSSSASVISGLAGILFVGFGAFIGGTIIRVFNVNSKMMTRWIAASALLYSIGMIILMNLSCDQNQLVHFGSKEIVSSGCSLSCNCAQDTYNPVCYDGATYVTPCLAGCKTRKAVDGRVIYGDCGCSSVANETVARPSLVDDSQMNLNIATNGQCSPNCDSIVWYVILFSIFTLIHSSCEVGSMMFNLRCVKPDDRTLALGLITFSSSLLGTIPCSIIYGSIVDSTCVHWDRYTIASDLSSSNNHGACRAYDNESFRYDLHGLTAAVMALAFIVDCIISRQSGEVNFYDCDSDESKMDIRVGLKKSTETIQ